MQMDGMHVVALVIEDQPVAAVGADADGVGLGILLAVDGPVIDGAIAGPLLFEDQGDALIRLGGGFIPAEDACSPTCSSGGAVHCGRAGTAGVLDHNAQAEIADLIVGIAQNPYAGLVHFDDGVDALGRAQLQDGDRGGVRHGVAIERHDGELVARKGQAMREGGVGVDDAEQDALPLAHSNGVARAERVAVDGERVVVDFERAFIAFAAAAVRGEKRIPAVKDEDDLLVVARRDSGAARGS